MISAPKINLSALRLALFSFLFPQVIASTLATAILFIHRAARGPHLLKCKVRTHSGTQWISLILAGCDMIRPTIRAEKTSCQLGVSVVLEQKRRNDGLIDSFLLSPVVLVVTKFPIGILILIPEIVSVSNTFETQDLGTISFITYAVFVPLLLGFIYPYLWVLASIVLDQLDFLVRDQIWSPFGQLKVQ